MNKFENFDECNKIILNDEENLINDMLVFFINEKKKLFFPIKTLCYFLKKTQEKNNDIFLKKEHSKLLMTIFKMIENENNKIDEMFKIMPFIQINKNPEILEMILNNYEKDSEYFWKKASSYLYFFFRNSNDLQANQWNTISYSESILSKLYQLILKERILKKKEKLKNFNEILIILMRIILKQNKNFLKINVINDDYQFCLECYITLSANYESAKIYFEMAGIYVHKNNFH